MKKIGIMTFHASYNCGSMMQAYALQKTLEKYNLEVEIIDFSNINQRNLYSVYDKKRNLKAFIKNIIFFCHRNRIKRNFDSYEGFKNKFFNLSSCNFFKEDQLSDEIYDVVISGSDQIWNITLEDGDDAYFLGWVKKASKVAYAPSLGARNITAYADNIDKYKILLNSFSALSIRENNGKKWLEKLLEGKRNIPVLLDPTLLLDEDEYEDLVDRTLKVPSKYIFYYSPGYNNRINNLVASISKKYHLPVIAFNTKTFYTKGMNLKGMKLPSIENPSAYLTLIKNASLIITTSFHGTIFSTIYRKKFWTIKNGEMFGDDDRVKTLIDALDINERLIEIDYDETFDYLAECDYYFYEKKLLELRKKSIEFLEESVLVN